MRVIAGAARRALAVAAIVATPATAEAQPVPARDSLALARARQLVTEGNGSSGRVLVDSVLQANAAGSPTYVEALWWRAVLAETAAPAERDLLRLAIEYPASRRAPEALLRLGQLELARNARDAAAKHFDRLITEHPDSPLLTQAYVGKGRALLDGPNRQEGCAALATARARVPASDVEFRNQIDFHAQRCGMAAGPTPAPASAPASAPAATPAATPAAPRANASAAPAAGPRFDVAAGTFPTRDRAIARLRAIERAGFDGRVGVAGPGKFRVFVGEAMPRAEAQALQQRLAAKKITGTTLLASSK